MKDSAGSYASPDFTNNVAELITFGAVIVNSFYYMTLHQASSVESLLILFSSFSKDVTPTASPKLIHSIDK